MVSEEIPYQEGENLPVARFETSQNICEVSQMSEGTIVGLRNEDSFVHNPEQIEASPYREQSGLPNRQQMRSPYREQSGLPNRQQMRSPYRQQMRSPYRQQMRSPYRQQMRSPYRQPIRPSYCQWTRSPEQTSHPYHCEWSPYPHPHYARPYGGPLAPYPYIHSYPWDGSPYTHVCHAHSYDRPPFSPILYAYDRPFPHNHHIMSPVPRDHSSPHCPSNICTQHSTPNRYSLAVPQSSDHEVMEEELNLENILESGGPDSPKRIKQSVKDECYRKASSEVNFAVLLVRKCYTKAEMSQSNCTGDCGKRMLSPKRMSAIKECVYSVYPIKPGETDESTWKRYKVAINESCRRLKRHVKKY